jgi:predicted acyl esterase
VASDEWSFLVRAGLGRLQNNLRTGRGRGRIAVAAVAASTAIGIALATGGQAGAAAPAPAQPAPGGSATPVLATTAPVFTSIPMSDGAKLQAFWIAPATPGLHPMILMPSTWGGGTTQMPLAAWKFAQRGYDAVIYSERGFNGSDGKVDVGGPQDMSDFSQVIDWSLKNTPADPNRIGATSISYGSGIALLGAAFDTRVKAVVSMSGWVDLTRSIHPNNTGNEFDGLGLWISGVIHGPLTADANRLLQDMTTGNQADYPWADQYTAVRSPSTYLATLNKNKPAIMFAQSINDPMFSPDQIEQFYNAYQGPKRLELRRGEHAGPEAFGVYAYPNVVWDDASRWFDTYLGGPDPTLSPAQQKPVLVEPRTEYGPAPNEYYDTPAQMTTATSKLYLTKPGGLILPSGQLTAAASTGWSNTIHAGINLLPSTAGGIPLVSYALEGLTGTPPALTTALIGRDSSSVWESPPAQNAVKVRGAPHVHVTVTPAAAKGMIIAYLYDQDASGLGTGYALDHEPFTWLTATPGKPLTLDFDMSPTAYDLPAGHRLTLVIGTQDLLYTDTNHLGDPMTISSPAGNASYVTIPTGS